MVLHDWILIGLTGVLAILTVALLVFSAQSARSSERLKEAIERLREIQENVRDIGLSDIGIRAERRETIPTSWLAEDFQIVTNNLEKLKRVSELHLFSPESRIKPGPVEWTRHEDKLYINFQLNMLPHILLALKTNAREPELISKRFTSRPVDRLLIQSRRRQEAENA